MNEGILAEIFKPIAKEMLIEEFIKTVLLAIAITIFTLKIIPGARNFLDKILGRQ